MPKRGRKRKCVASDASETLVLDQRDTGHMVVQHLEECGHETHATAQHSPGELRAMALLHRIKEACAWYTKMTIGPEPEPPFSLLLVCKHSTDLADALE